MQSLCYGLQPSNNVVWTVFNCHAIICIYAVNKVMRVKQTSVGSNFMYYVYFNLEIGLITHASKPWNVHWKVNFE